MIIVTRIYLPSGDLQGIWPSPGLLGERATSALDAPADGRE